MSKIDWSKAPDWADGHALVAHHGITEVWVSPEQYAVVGAEDRAYPYGGGIGDHRQNFTQGQIQYITPRPDRWDGHGAPPVGTVCQVLWNESRLEYFKTKIFGINEHGQPIHRFEEGPKIYEYQADVLRTDSGTQVFRPLKTSEQIAADEREKAVKDLYYTINWAENPEHWSHIGECRKADYAKAIDAGYRKQMAP